MRLAELIVYRLAMELADGVWNLVATWPPFAKDAMGLQWVRAIDSVAANLIEGFGRFYFKENRQFCYYAGGSLSEAETWFHKACRRNLVPGELRVEMQTSFDLLGRRLNAYITSIGRQSSKSTNSDQ
jgi:four helix bundle protein